MTSLTHAPLLLFALVATLSPGGSTALATASGANFGFWRSLPLIGGTALALASMAALAAAGLAGVLLAVPSLHVALKLAGSAYLLWLAWGLAGRGAPGARAGGARPIGLLAGVGLLWLNPKAWAMTLAAAASFVALAEGPARLALLLGLAFGSFSLLSMSAWCLAGLLLARLLRREAQWRALNIALALLLAASVVPIWL